MEPDERRWISDLHDLTGMGMDHIDDIPEPDLLRSLRRILAEAGTLTEQYASFDNAIDTPRDARVFLKPDRLNADRAGESW
jgi:FXSXX-COOH protein